jgi:hypothetical protein
MHTDAADLDVVFVDFGGTENGPSRLDTTACTDSLAAMIANTLVILAPSRASLGLRPGDESASAGTDARSLTRA